jgi:hypothetical protein
MYCRIRFLGRECRAACDDTVDGLAVPDPAWPPLQALLDRVDGSADDESPLRINDAIDDVEGRLIDLGLRASYMYYKKHFSYAVCVHTYAMDSVPFKMPTHFVVSELHRLKLGLRTKRVFLHPTKCERKDNWEHDSDLTT